MPGYLDFIDHITANLQGKAAPSTLAHIAELHAQDLVRASGGHLSLAQARVQATQNIAEGNQYNEDASNRRLLVIGGIVGGIGLLFLLSGKRRR